MTVVHVLEQVSGSEQMSVFVYALMMFLAGCSASFRESLGNFLLFRRREIQRQTVDIFHVQTCVYIGLSCQQSLPLRNIATNFNDFTFMETLDCSYSKNSILLPATCLRSSHHFRYLTSWERRSKVCHPTVFATFN